MDEMKNENIEGYDKIIDIVRIMYADTVSGISKIKAQRDEMNRGTSTLPPVLSKSLLQFSRASFGDLINL